MVKVTLVLAHATLSAAYALEGFHVNHISVSMLLAAAYLVIAAKYLLDAIEGSRGK